MVVVFIEVKVTLFKVEVYLLDEWGCLFQTALLEVILLLLEVPLLLENTLFLKI